MTLDPTTRLIRDTWITNRPTGVNETQAATTFDRWLEREHRPHSTQYSDDPNIRYDTDPTAIDDTGEALMLMHDRLADMHDELTELIDDAHNGLDDEQRARLRRHTASDIATVMRQLDALIDTLHFTQDSAAGLMRRHYADTRRHD